MLGVYRHLSESGGELKQVGSDSIVRQPCWIQCGVDNRPCVGIVHGDWSAEGRPRHQPAGALRVKQPDLTGRLAASKFWYYGLVGIVNCS